MIRIGISGWRYAPWRGVFYPQKLPQRRELEFAARHFPSLEINGSFYSLQRPEYYEQWYAASPPGFVYAVKGSRYITHLRRLKDIDKPLANFFASGVLALQDKLGPLLWQFPPQFRFDAERLDAFLRKLPMDSRQALALARKRDSRVKGRSRLAIDAVRRLRHALEVRHASFVTPEFFALLRRHGVGLVVADTAGRFPRLFDVTADFVYVRLHGDIEIYKSGYTPRALDEWAKRIRAWHRDGKDVYVYFDNDMKVRAPFDALELMERLDLAWDPVDDAEPDDPPFRVHRAGGRMPRLKAYGPRVTGGNPAWDKLGRR